MPTLAKQIVDSNAEGKNFVLNFKGFAVGNPYTDPYSGTPAMIGNAKAFNYILQCLYVKCVLL